LTGFRAAASFGGPAARAFRLRERPTEEGVVRRLRFKIPFLCAALLLAAVTGVAQAAPKKVLLTHEGGKPATQGEVSKFSGRVAIAGVQCFGTDQNGSMGPNPSGTVIVSGSNTPETEIACLGEGTAKGSLTVKSAKFSKKGLVTWDIDALLQQPSGCTYVVKKMSGTINSGEQSANAALTGTGKLRKAMSPRGACAGTVPAEGFVGVSDANFENYVVSF
jgi:hypothetical protein